MTIKQKKALFSVIGIAFWLVIWEVSARILDISYIYPAFTQTVAALFKLILTGEFYLTVLSSLGRIILGFMLGTVVGIGLGILSHLSELLCSVIHPFMSIIRATPVASIIIILWFFISKDYIPLVIGLFMVSPIIWQSTYDSLHFKNRELYEVADIFGLNRRIRLKILVLPTITKYLLPAIVTSSALAWKSGVAAEIITYTKRSIGYEIANAKNIYEGADMFAWTATVIILSVAIEMLIKFIVRRMQSKWG